MRPPQIREPRALMLPERRLNEEIRRDPQSAAFSIMPTLVAVSRADVVAALSNEYLKIDALTAYNRNGSTADTLTLNIIENGGSASAANRIYNLSIAADATVSLDALKGVIIDPSAAVSAVSANGDVVLTGGGTRIFSGFSA